MGNSNCRHWGEVIVAGQAWAFAAFAELPAHAAPTQTASFLISEGPGKGDGVLPYLGYVSSGPEDLHIACGPMQKKKTWQCDQTLTDIVAAWCREDARIPVMVGGEVADLRATQMDGCRVFLRYLPDQVVADALIAVGDAITTCGMITNIMTMKTGDIAAQVASDAITRSDTSAAGLAGFEQRINKLQMYKGMNWMNNLMIKAPIELDREGLDRLYNLLRSLNLGKVQAGQVSPIIWFYLRMIPTLMFDAKMCTYLAP